MGQIQSRPGLPSHDVLEDLFDALTKPDELKAYLQRSHSLEIQVELLCSTLRVDAALLKVGEVGEQEERETVGVLDRIRCTCATEAPKTPRMSGSPASRRSKTGAQEAAEPACTIDRQLT